MNARTKMTPRQHTAGIFVLKPPFDASVNVVYTVEAVESLSELKSDRVDIFTRYYQPKKLTTADCSADESANASIVTLRAGDGSVIEVPDTYILAYPGDAGISHTRRVLICDLGMVPDSMAVDFLIPDVSDVVRKSLGVISEVQLAVAPTRTELTYQQYIDSEKKRRANVATYESKDELIARLTASNNELKDRVSMLEELIIAMEEQKK